MSCAVTDAARSAAKTEEAETGKHAALFGGGWSSRSTAEEPPPQRRPLLAPEGFVFPASLFSDPVEVVLRVVFGWRARGPKERHVLRAGVLGVRAAIRTHARHYALCEWRTGSRP